MILTLPPLEAAGFLLHRKQPAVAGLTLAPQAFYFSVCPTAKILSRYPQWLRAWLSTGNHQGIVQLNMFFSVQTFTWRTSRHNALVRVSKNFERAHYTSMRRYRREGGASLCFAPRQIHPTTGSRA